MDAASHRPLAMAISTLKDRAVSLCSRINDYAKTSDLPPERRIPRSLVAELRLYAGALFALETLAVELEPAVGQPAGPAALPLDRFSFLCQVGETLDSFQEIFAKAPEHISDLRALARKYRNRITFVLASTQSYADLTMLLSIGTHAKEDEPDLDAKDLSKWLTILNAPYHNRPPREEYLQRQFVAGRLVDFPGYTEAAMNWPLFAEEHWSTIQKQVKTLFVMPRSYNFVQWVLEYAREASHDCQEADALLGLTSSLRDGSASPLHLAAAFALPSLVESLLAGGADVNQDGGWLGSPLFCALVGPDVLTEGSAPESMNDLFCYGVRPPARRIIIKKLLDSGADCTYQINAEDGEVGSLALLAFWFSCIVNDHTIFERVVSGGAVIDEDFDRVLVSGTDLMGRARPSPSTLALLITCVLDSILGCKSELPWYYETILDGVKSFMSDHHLKFVDGPGPSRLLNVMSEHRLRQLVVSAIIEDEILCLERLAMDPRFDPNQLAQQEDNGTIAHLAVGGDQLEVVDILLRAGSDFAMRDDQGRTPLMLSETEPMLTKLIQHGVSTTATDNKGRNIWYYAAAANSDVMIGFLTRKDPSKKENIGAASARGTTPLDKALRYAKQLITVSKAHADRPTPMVARLLLRDGARCKNSGPHPAFLMGAEWGNTELAESLVDAGADPRATDGMGENALHKLNLAATPQLVSYVQRLCKGMPLATGAAADADCKGDQGKKRKRARTRADKVLTPAETILTNTAVVNLHGYSQASGHPSCKRPLSEEAYTLLLTPEQLAYHDASGMGLWARFCKIVLARYEHLTGWPPQGDLGFLGKSVHTALKCQVRAGALARYEDETGRAAVLLLAKVHGDGHLEWLPQRLPFAYDLLRQFDSPLTREFLLTQAAHDMLMLAHKHHRGLLDWLTATRARLRQANGEDPCATCPAIV